MSQEEEDRRPTRPRSPTSQEFEDFQHPAPAVRAHQPSEAHLSRLPDVLFPHLCSFLTTRAVYRLAATCSALSRLCFPSTVTLCRREELLKADEQPQQQTDRCGEALGTLVRRGAGRLKELRVNNADLVEPLLRAMRDCEPAVQLERLTSLRVPMSARPVQAPQMGQPSTSEDVLLVRDMLGRVPMLRELRITLDTDASSLSPTWRALREGACPKLARVHMSGCSPAVLVGLASALPSRSEGCARLKALTVHIIHRQPCEGLEEACRALANCLEPGSLEELSVWGWVCPAEWFNAAVSRLSTCEWPALRWLTLCGGELVDERECDALLHALARGMSAELRQLSLTGLRPSDDGWRGLGEAMAAGPCLRPLKTLTLRRVFRDPEQLETFARGIGAGHGCPDLEVLTLNPYEEEVAQHGGTDWSPLAHALRPPAGLPRLRSLHLNTTRPSRIGALMEALEHRPHAIEPLRKARLSLTRGVADVALSSGLVGAMADGGGLAGLDMLQMVPFFIDQAGTTASWMRQLVEAIEAGGGKRLGVIQCIVPESAEAPAAMTNRLLRALVEKGACPNLRELFLVSPTRIHDVAVGGGLDTGLVQALLTGGAACSATLRDVAILSCGFGAVELVALEACLRDPRVVQLSMLQLIVIGQDALPALLAVLDALGHGQAGARLWRLMIEVQGWSESQAMEVVQRLVEIVYAGGLSTFASLFSARSSLPEVVLSGKRVGEAELQQAVKRRAGEVWQASW